MKRAEHPTCPRGHLTIFDEIHSMACSISSDLRLQIYISVKLEDKS